MNIYMKLVLFIVSGGRIFWERVRYPDIFGVFVRQDKVFSTEFLQTVCGRTRQQHQVCDVLSKFPIKKQRTISTSYVILLKPEQRATYNESDPTHPTLHHWSQILYRRTLPFIRTPC
jgi:hypothetical protein